MKQFLIASGLALATALSATMAAGAPAEASVNRQVALAAPTVSHVGSAVVLRGKVVGKVKKVAVEKRAGGRWALVRRVAVRHGRYAVQVRPTAPRTSYRVSTTGTAATASRVVAVTQAAPASDACGVRPAKADGSLWSCSFDDEFSGTSLDRTKWLPQRPFATGVDGARACAVDDGTTVKVGNGELDLLVRKLATPMKCGTATSSPTAQYAAGMVSTYRMFSQQYGRWEARIKNTATTAPGLQESFWLWPDDRVASSTVWPWAGEIDVSETYSQYPTLSIPFLHYAADVYGNLVGTNTAWNCTAARGAWNTYRLDWSASRLEVFVNGTSCLVNTSADPAFAKPYIAAFTAALGVNGNAYTGKAAIPATMAIDYLRVWK